MVLSILCAAGVPTLWVRGGAWIREANDESDDCNHDYDCPGCHSVDVNGTDVTETICVDCLTFMCDNEDVVKTEVSSPLLNITLLVPHQAEFVVHIFSVYINDHLRHENN